MKLNNLDEIQNMYGFVRKTVINNYKKGKVKIMNSLRTRMPTLKNNAGNYKLVYI